MRTPGAPSVCVLHLVWAPLGPEPLRRFLAAYRFVDAGVDHELALVVNGGDPGFVDEEAPDVRRHLLGGSVQDLEAYRLAMVELPATSYVLVNSYARPLVDGWLGRLVEPLGAAGIGAVGATGSWESQRPHFPLVPPKSHLAGKPGRIGRIAVGSARRHAHVRRWFDPFPNPHLRTNALAIRRDAVQRAGWGPVLHRGSALAWESGRRGLRASLLASGVGEQMIATRSGAVVPPPEWPEARTFRSGDQEQLLVADNRTDHYARADAAERRWLGELAWGDRFVP